MNVSIRTVSLAVALVSASLAVGCAADPAAEPGSSSAPQALTSEFDGVSVVAESDARGVVHATPMNERGEPILVLTVEGDRLTIEPRADRSLAPWSGPVPAEARAAGDLADFSFIAYAYSARLSPAAPPSTPGAVRPQMQAGTDGQMCIAAGGTAMECAYWLYCRKHWCPLW